MYPGVECLDGIVGYDLPLTHPSNVACHDHLLTQLLIHPDLQITRGPGGSNRVRGPIKGRFPLDVILTVHPHSGHAAEPPLLVFRTAYQGSMANQF